MSTCKYPPGTQVTIVRGRFYTELLVETVQTLHTIQAHCYCQEKGPNLRVLTKTNLQYIAFSISPFSLCVRKTIGYMDKWIVAWVGCFAEWRKFDQMFTLGVSEHGVSVCRELVHSGSQTWQL